MMKQPTRFEVSRYEEKKKSKDGKTVFPALLLLGATEDKDGKRWEGEFWVSAWSLMLKKDAKELDEKTLTSITLSPHPSGKSFLIEGHEEKVN